MKCIKSIIFFALILMSCKSLAYDPEEGKVTATLGPYINRTNFEESRTGAKASYLGGMSLVAVGDISTKGSLEISMIYSPQLFFADTAGKYLAEKVQVVHVSMGYRWWLSPYLSTSLAFFSAYSLGEVEIVHDDFGVDPLKPTTSARDATEYGFDWSVQGELWSQNKYAVIAEGRYSLSVTNKKNEHSDQYGVLIGLRYDIQDEKKVEAKKPDAI